MPGSDLAHRSRWVTAGLLDQVVIALANAGNTLLALILLSRERAGILVLSLGLAYLVVGINRAFVGDVLLALASRYEGERRDTLVRDGLAAAAAVGALAGVVLLGVWLIWPTGGKIDLRDLVWVAPFLPIILLHDTGRCAYLAERRPERALVVDLVWVGTQAACVALLHAGPGDSAGGLLLSWGVGATAGATAFLWRTGQRPWRGRPRRWLVDTRHLSGWFTATAVVAQVQVQAVSFVVGGQLSQRALSGLRGAQSVLLQPVQNFITAVMGLVVPRASQLAGAARQPGPAGAVAAAGLRRQTRLLAAVLAGLGALLVAVVVPVAHALLGHVPKFADLRPLALPMSLQAAIYLLQVPFTAAMRGMHRARMLFVQYALFAVATLAGLVSGAALGELPGAAWGLTVGATVGLALMVGMYRYAVARVATAGPADAGTVEVLEVG